LLHGHASLSAEFELLRSRASAPIPSAIDQDEADEGDSANVFAAELFTYRKRGLLAPYGVGTIDQALLAIPKTRLFLVRMFGLAFIRDSRGPVPQDADFAAGHLQRREDGTNKITSADATSIVSNGNTGQRGWRDVRFSYASLIANVFRWTAGRNRTMTTDIIDFPLSPTRRLAASARPNPIRRRAQWFGASRSRWVRLGELGFGKIHGRGGPRS
jgi:hypothetical protein